MAKVPVYTSIQDLRAQFSIGDPKPIESIKRIAHRENTLYLLEEDKGIHVVDFSDTQNVQKQAFITAPGIEDFVIVDGHLYFAQASDMVTLDISNPSAISLVQTRGRSFNTQMIKQDSFITGYVEKEVVETRSNVSCSESFIEPAIDEPLGLSREPHVAMHARNNHIYASDNTHFFAIDATVRTKITFSHIQEFFGDGLGPSYVSSNSRFVFAGNPSFISAFDIQNNPGRPPRISAFWAGGSCHHFFVDNDLMFVPHFGKEDVNCSDRNLFTLVDVSNEFAPIVIDRFILTQPKYASSHDGQMVLCDGTGGFRTFNIKNISPNSFLQQQQVFNEDIEASVSHSMKDLIIIWGENGLHFFGTRNPFQLELKSRLAQ